MVSFDLSFLSWLSSFLLPQTFTEVCLLSLVVLVSLLLRTILSISEWFPECIWDVLSDMSKRMSFMAEKLSYIERRLDAAQATLLDVVRHVAERVTEYDPEIGAFSVLTRWLSGERDQFSLRRPEFAEWTAVSATAQISVINELIYERITAPGEDTEKKVSRVVSTLQKLSKQAYSGWACLRPQDEDLNAENILGLSTLSSRPSGLIMDHLREALDHHQRGLQKVAEEWKIDWAGVSKVLSLSDIFCSSSSGSS